MNLNRLIGSDRYQEFVTATPNARWLFLITGGPAVVGSAFALWQVARRAQTGLGDETAVVLMSVTWLWLIGWLAALAGRLPGRAVRADQGALLVVVAVISAVQIREVRPLLQFVATRDTLRGVGTPICYEIRAVQTATCLEEELADSRTG